MTEAGRNDLYKYRCYKQMVNACTKLKKSLLVYFTPLYLNNTEQYRREDN